MQSMLTLGGFQVRVHPSGETSVISRGPSGGLGASATQTGQMCNTLKQPCSEQQTVISTGENVQLD